MKRCHLQQHEYNQRLSYNVKKKDKTPYNIIYMKNLKYDANELIFETEINSQRRGLWFAKGEAVWERVGLGI